MKTNPLRAHFIGGVGADGSVKGFIAHKKILFKHATRGLDLTEIYSALADASINDSKSALKRIKEWADQAAANFKNMTATIDEAEKCMGTLANVFDMIDAQIEEQITKPEAKP